MVSRAAWATKPRFLCDINGFLCGDRLANLWFISKTAAVQLALRGHDVGRPCHTLHAEDITKLMTKSMYTSQFAV